MADNLNTLMYNVSMKKRVLSGIRATGRLHLGNYLGAIKGMLVLQNNDDYETLYMVADLHAVTTPYDINELRKNRREIIIDYLAAGLDPKKSVLFQQADVPQHAELTFYLSSVVTIARMQHLPTFKDKVKQYPEAATMALLNYPILMTSDILLYKAGLVPVGIDQEPHIEVAREIAGKMNQQYGMDFPEPIRFKTEGSYIPSLTGTGKMSKSVEGSFINLTDDLETIKAKLAKVPTDSGTIGGNIPESGGVGNLFTLFKLFFDKDTFVKFVIDYREKKIRYSEMKQLLADAIYKELQPFQEKRKYFEEHPEEVDKIIKEGNEKAREIASATVREVREKMGLL
jgi:tryptophanyl-tRNA synthetase